MVKQFKTLAILAILSLLPIATACIPNNQLSATGSMNNLSSAERLPVATTELENTSWVLNTYGPANSPLLVSPELKITAVFEGDGTMRGQSGCNTYATHLQINQQVITIGEVQQTQFGCSDDESWRQEKTFINALQTSHSIWREGDLLIISYPDGFLNFLPEQEPSASLEGTHWQLINIKAAGSVQPLIPTAIITARFTDGKILGTAGCNDYHGAYQESGQSFIMWEMILTTESCPEESIMSQEKQFLSALHSAESFRLDDHTLTIYFSGGELHFARKHSLTDEPFTGTLWQLSTIKAGDETYLSQENNILTAEFVDDQINIFTDCYHYFARYTATGESAITIDDPGSSKTACSDETAIQTGDFLESFIQPGMIDVVFEDDQLTLTRNNLSFSFSTNHLSGKPDNATTFR